MKTEDFIKEIEKKLSSINISPKSENVGNVLRISDGIIHASGLSLAGFGEEVEFEDGTRGLVFNLDEDYVSIILLSTSTNIVEGTKVKSTGKILGVEVSDALIGRTVDPLLSALDGKQLKIKGKVYPLEKIAPGVIMRQPVNTPIKTGIKDKKKVPKLT